VMAVAFLNGVWRRRAVRGGLRAAHWIRTRFQRHAHEPGKYAAIARNLEESTQLLHKRWIPMWVALFWVWMDWTFTAFTLQQCYAAVGVFLSPGALLVGFTLAFLSSTVNIIPGGLGIMEGLIAMTYSHFDIPSEKAIVAALLFRLIYFLLPLALSAALYLDTLLKLVRNTPQNSDKIT